MHNIAKTAAIIGGGVIGGGWVARFLLNGWNVNVFDPDPEAEKKIDDVLANARRCMPAVVEHQLPIEGKLTFYDTLEDAISNAQWIQESIPERIELKQSLFEQVYRIAPSNAIIASSTSGFTPTELNASLDTPRVIVAHPFNPVYLLPLVEIVFHPDSNRNKLKGIESVLLSIGMEPITLDKEIPAHIADRLLEAVWRESLWLVKDGIATTETIDNAIRYGFGLRWAQMGLFETYRVAGGVAGMRHFMSQFGPTLELPWTKLMDVPEFNNELVDLIANQSDKQSGAYSIRELERIRDDNLTDMILAQKKRNWGVGQVFNKFDQYLREHSDNIDPLTNFDIVKPLELQRCIVLPTWIDYNGHMNESRYLQVFGDSTDILMTYLGIDENYLKVGSYFTVETHIMHIDETGVNSELYVTTQILSADSKRMHLFHSIYNADDDRVLATGEQMLLHVDMNTRRTAPASEAILQRLMPIANAHQQLDKPDVCGRYVGQR